MNKVEAQHLRELVVKVMAEFVDIAKVDTYSSSAPEVLEHISSKVDKAVSDLAQYIDAHEDQVIAVIGGGDWADASCHHMVVPIGVDIEAVRAEYKAWYTAFNKQTPEARRKAQYKTFEEFLRERGARDTTETELVECSDD